MICDQQVIEKEISKNIPKEEGGGLRKLKTGVTLKLLDGLKKKIETGDVTEE